MRSSFSEQEIADYRRDGFLAVDDFLNTEELAGWREVVEAAVEDASVKPGGRNSDKVFTQRMHLRRKSAAVGQLVEDPAVGRLVAELEGVEAVRLYLDQALVKEPYGAPTQYHLDIPWWSFSSPHACTIWVALDDSTLENGCLYFVPGSHRSRLTEVGDLGPDLGAVFTAHPTAASGPTPCPLPATRRRLLVPQRPHDPRRRREHDAGEARHDDNRVHAGRCPLQRPPRRPGPRQEYLATLAENDPLANDELNPLVYAGR